MSDTCKVCKETFEGGTCKYCGFENIVMLGGTSDPVMDEYAVSHKNRVINSIKNISVKTYKYGWNASNTEVEEKSTSKVRICDGVDCFNKVYKCAEKFGQNPAESASERTMHISYEVNGKEKTVPVTIKPVKCPEFWELAIKIDENLKLAVYVGVDGNCAEKSGVKLELV